MKNSRLLNESGKKLPRPMSMGCAWRDCGKTGITIERTGKAGCRSLRTRTTQGTICCYIYMLCQSKETSGVHVGRLFTISCKCHWWPITWRTFKGKPHEEHLSTVMLSNVTLCWVYCRPLKWLLLQCHLKRRLLALRLEGHLRTISESCKGRKNLCVRHSMSVTELKERQAWQS
jgi:hypothetical protein